MFHIINSILWAFITTLIIIVGIKLTKKTNYQQFKIKSILKSIKKQNLNTLFLTLAGRIGVGSIAGIALAIYLGGPGTIFWLWIIAIISASITYSETLIAIKYRTKTSGGPIKYISSGLKNKKLAATYAILIIIAYQIGFIPIQSNTIIKSLDTIIHTNHLVIGTILAIITFIIIKGGIKKITKVTNYLVPIMGFVYILLTTVIILSNIEKIPTIITNILSSALNIKSFFTSFIPTLLIGTQRGIFANEAGLGIGTIAASTTPSNNPNQIANTQILGVYITTCIICTSTALIVLIYDNYTKAINPNGIEIITAAFNYFFKTKGQLILFICILLFAFSTILTGHYYYEVALKHFKLPTALAHILTPISIIIGTITTPTIIWQCIDILVATIGIINIYSIIKLKKEIVALHQKCDRI